MFYRTLPVFHLNKTELTRRNRSKKKYKSISNGYYDPKRKSSPGVNTFCGNIYYSKENKGHLLFLVYYEDYGEIKYEHVVIKQCSKC